MPLVPTLDIPLSSVKHSLTSFYTFLLCSVFIDLFLVEFQLIVFSTRLISIVSKPIKVVVVVVVIVVVATLGSNLNFNLS